MSITYVITTNWGDRAEAHSARAALLARHTLERDHGVAGARAVILGPFNVVPQWQIDDLAERVARDEMTLVEAHALLVEEHGPDRSEPFDA